MGAHATDVRSHSSGWHPRLVVGPYGRRIEQESPGSCRDPTVISAAVRRHLAGPRRRAFLNFPSRVRFKIANVLAYLIRERSADLDHENRSLGREFMNLTSERRTDWTAPDDEDVDVRGVRRTHARSATSSRRI